MPNHPLLNMPTQRCDFKVHLDKPVDFDQLDSWLNKLAITLSAEEKKALGIEGIMIRLSKFINALYQACKIPAFDDRSFQIKQINPHYWECSLFLSKMEYMPSEIYQNTSNSAFRILVGFINTAPSDDKLKVLYQKLEEEFITPVSKFVAGGKSTIPILREAYKEGIPFQHLGLGVYQFGWGANSRRMERSGGENDSAIGAKLSNNKYLSACLLRDAGLPAASHGVAQSGKTAVKLAGHLGFPLVIKPLDADRGEGVTINIRSYEQIQAAIEHALAFSKGKAALVEQQVEGCCHRLFIVEEKLLYAVKRTPRTITMDGKLQIHQRIDEKNKQDLLLPPWLRKGPLPQGQRAIEALMKQGYDLNSIPPKGTNVDLRLIESTQWGGGSIDVTDNVHPDNLSAAIEAARLFNLAISGIDIITHDISLPWYETGAIINEVNYFPSLGNSDVSRSYLSKFLDMYIPQKGLIPVEILSLSDNFWESGLLRQKYWIEKGLRCYLSSKEKTINEQGVEINLAQNDLSARWNALKNNRHVDAAILLED